MPSNYPFLTSKERDNETGLDYFLARYYSSTQGRFTSPDPAGPDPLNPQTLNGYRYALNNPLRYIDPNGQYERDVHLDLTYVLALAVGFDPRTASKIADGNQRADTDPDKDPTRILNVAARKMYHFTTPLERGARWVEFLNEPTEFRLGLYTHAVQDMYSHEGKGPDIGQISFDWPTKWPDVDKTYNDIPKANLMAETTYDQLKQGFEVMRTGLNQTFGTVPYQKLEKYIVLFNSARSDKDKKAALMAMKGEITKYRHSQRGVSKSVHSDSDPWRSGKALMYRPSFFK